MNKHTQHIVNIFLKKFDAQYLSVLDQIVNLFALYFFFGRDSKSSFSLFIVLTAVVVEFSVYNCSHGSSWICSCVIAMISLKG